MFYPLAGNKVSPDMQRLLYLPADKNQATSNLQNFVQSLDKQTNVGSSTFKMLSKVYHVDAELKPQVTPLFKGNVQSGSRVGRFQRSSEVAASVNSWVGPGNERNDQRVHASRRSPSGQRSDAAERCSVERFLGSPLQPEETESVNFHFVNGDHPVQMMFKQEQILYANLPDHGCQAVELLYEDGTDLSMVVVLPMKKSSLENLVREFSVALYGKINERLSMERIQLALPKFTMRKKIDAQQLLKNMGLKALFEELDLDLLVRDKSRIGEIRQTTFIKVNEKGTEGAAATETQAVGRAGYPNFYVDHPFLYLIRKRSTKDIIFIGHYSVHEQ
nr:leukocyte elastase inhibitor [Aedes albopictus]